MSDQTIVLVTGANSGIGYATAKVIAASSPKYHVIMTGRSLDKVEAAKKEIESNNELQGTLSTLQLDVVDEASIAAAAKQVEKDFGRVDVLINNAGAAGLGEDSYKKQLEAVFMANIAGPLLVAEAFMPLVEKSKNPYSLYISSTLGSLGFAADPDNDRYYNSNWQVYRTSKAGLNMVALTESHKWRAKGVKTFAVCPGLVRSNLRGTSEEQISAGGHAGDPDVSGQLNLDIIEGKRDADVGKFVATDGAVRPW